MHTDRKETLYHAGVMVLFLIAFFSRVTLMGMHQDYPKPLMSSDSIFHSLISEHIADTGKVSVMAPFMVEGHTDVVDFVPQHQAILAASLNMFSGARHWNILYFIVSFISALSVPLLYLVVLKIFDRHEIAILASAMVVLPLNLNRWMYYFFIGMWPQAIVISFILFCALLALMYIEDGKRVYLLLLSIGLSATLLLHFSEIALILPVLAYVGYKIISSHKTIDEKLKDIMAVSVLPAIAFVLSFRTLFFVRWGFYGIKYLGFHIPDFKTLNFVTTYKDLHVIMIVLMALGLIQLCLNWKKYIGLVIMSFYILLLYFLPYFVTDYYLLRFRILLLYFFAIIAAYGMYSFVVIHLSGIIKSDRYFPAAAIGLIIILLGIPGFAQVKSTFDRGGLFDKEGFQAYEWIDRNTPEDAEFFILGNDMQNQASMGKRVRFMFDWDSLPEVIGYYSANNRSFPEIYKGDYNGYFGWGLASHYTGLFEVSHYDTRGDIANISEFDYVVFENFMPEIDKFNYPLAQYLMAKHGYRQVYRQGRMLILER